MAPFHAVEESEPASRLEVRLLGGFSVSIDGAEVAAERWPSLRAAQLVQLLSLAPQRRMTRDRVVDTLWPQLDPDAGAANLRKAAHHARQALGRHDGWCCMAARWCCGPMAALPSMSTASSGWRSRR
ncbi:MAG: hypothetical protein ABT20_13340 [Rubrivivax sp. SCN 70-15]|nr:MAG: hypothetical protein ABT20_13340 [Rubrivivax sp. SCN 70-15]